MIRGEEEQPLVEACVGKVYARRWWMLTLFCALNLMLASFWGTFLPISTTVQEFLHISGFGVDLLTQCFYALCLPATLLSTWVLERWGLRNGLLIGAVMGTFGASIRAVPFFFPNIGSEGMYSALLAGQCLNAIAQPFVFNAPAKVSWLWFAPEERVVTTTLAWLSNGLGGSVAMYVGSWAVPDGEGSAIGRFMFVEALVMASVTLLVIVAFQDHPPQPPSGIVDQRGQAKGLFGGSGDILRVKRYWLILLSFGISFGINSAICTLMDPMLHRFYSQSNIGLFGALLLLAGLVCAIIVSLLLRRHHPQVYKAWAVAFFLLTVICQVWLALIAEVPDQEVMMAFCMIIFGASLISYQPLCVEIGAELVFPLPEATSTGILLICGNIMSLLMVFAIRALKDPVTGSLRSGNWMEVGSAVVGLILISLYPHECRRHVAEAQLVIKSVQQHPRSHKCGS